jgi:hypothetical protein
MCSRPISTHLAHLRRCVTCDNDLCPQLASFFDGTPANTQHATNTVLFAASKIWELSWGLGLRANLWSTGIRFNILCPGFVDTKMPRSVPSIRNGVHTGAPARGEDLPFIVSPAKIAAIFASALSRDQAVIIYPSILYVLGGLIYKAPWPIQDFLMRHVSSGTGLLGNVFGHTDAAQAPAYPDRKKEE